MKITLARAAITLVLTMTAGGQLGVRVARAQETGLTIYRDGRVMTRRVLPIALPRGESSHRLELGPLDPSTVMALDPDVRVVRFRYAADTEERAVQRRALGHAIVFVRGTDTVTATVVGVDPLRYRLADGSIAFSVPGVAHYPVELVATTPVLILTVTARRARPTLELGFMGSGANWRASYGVVLEGADAVVSGSALISSATLAADDADVQLLAGEINRVTSGGILEEESVPVRSAQFGNAVAGYVPVRQAVGDAHLYSLPETVTLIPGESVGVPLFEPEHTAYRRHYLVTGALPWYGELRQAPGEEEPPVRVIYDVTRAAGSGFGEQPLPAGVVRLYRADAAGRRQMIGEVPIGHTPPGRDLELDAGTAFDLTARRVQESYRSRREGSRRVADASYTVTLTNARDTTATVEIRETRRGDWSITESSIPVDRLSSTVARFTASVPGGAEFRFSYHVRAVW